MKKCIWCSRGIPSVTFDKLAHTFPKSLGGKNICSNVCDDCNKYFGSPQQLTPAVEVVLKEFLNISKYSLLRNLPDVHLPRFKSEYFKIDRNFTQIKIKPRYKIKHQFKRSLGTLFRRGIYKVYLEERERILGDAQDDRFNFIRHFSRYGLDDYPIYFLKPKFDLVLFSTVYTINPELSFSKSQEKEDKEFRIFSYPIMGHYFCIPTSPYFKQLYLKEYTKHLRKEDGPLGKELIEIEFAENLDFLFTYLNKGRM